jgi:AcrR family transcriptional regulator
MPSKYHHGDLRATLVTASLDLIAEQGLRGFSVAEAARRAGVSPGAPYRHFPDRQSLLAAVAGRVAVQLTERIEAETSARDSPADKLAAAAGAYTAYVIARRAGLHVVFAAGLDDPKYAELHELSRTLMDHFLLLSLAVAPDAPAALELMEQLLAQAHGYATFQLDGVLAQHGYSADLVAAKSFEAALVVIRGHVGSDT